jgi:hypothetical protein
VLDLLRSEDDGRARLATEIVWACIASTSGHAAEIPDLAAHPSEALLDGLEAAVSTMPVSPRKREALLRWISSTRDRARPS